MFGNKGRKEKNNMPNHVKNILTFKKLKPTDKDFILERFATWCEESHESIFDFDKVIPEPKSEGECPKDCLVNKDSHILEYKDRPWFNWYAWHLKYWGTKWNAYDGITYSYGDTVEFSFHTAWSAPYPVYEQLAKLYPNFEWEVRYADECIGENCGIIKHDKLTTYIYEYEDEDTTPDKIYKDVWGCSESEDD